MTNPTTTPTPVVSAPVVDLAEIKRLVEAYGKAVHESSCFCCGDTSKLTTEQFTAKMGMLTRAERSAEQALLTAIRQLASAPVAVPAESYLIWSNEHQAWWRPNSAGYTVHLLSAGRYSRQEAVAIARNARDGWREWCPPSEFVISERDALACIAAEDTCQLAARTPPAFDDGPDDARAQPHVCPDGWRCMPNEPTHEMLEAGEEARLENTDRYLDGSEVARDVVEPIYRAMLAVAPHPPVGEKAAAHPEETSDV